MSLTQRTEMRRCGKGKRYATEDEALRSKIGRVEGNIAVHCGNCDGWHIRFPEAHRRALTHARRRRPPRDPEWYAQDAERRFAKASREGPPPEYRPELGPCLLYTGATNSSGYGQFRYEQRNGYAHRYAWERVKGRIPARLTIDHLCRVRTCVRLEHLELVDGPTNTRRGVKAKKKCPKGHRYPDDDISHPRGRRCPVCEQNTRERSEAKRRRIANELPDRRIAFDQDLIRSAVCDIRTGCTSISQAAREIGCNKNYLGRRAWEATRRDVDARDERICAGCGGIAVDVQHRIARGQGGSRNPLIAYGLANLISLCRRCHDICEQRDPVMHERGLWLDSSEDPLLVPVEYRGENGGFTRWLTADGGLSAEPPGRAA